MKLNQTNHFHAPTRFSPFALSPHHSIAFRLFSIALLISMCACSGKRGDPASTLEIAKGLHAGALANDTRFAISGSVNHGISLWRLSDNERLYDWNHKPDEPTTLLSADFSPAADFALTADVVTLVLWDTQSGKALRYWAAPSEIHDVALTRDAQFALLGLEDHSAVLFDIQNGGIRRTLRHKNRVRSVSVDKQTTIALTGSEDSTATTWQLETGEAIVSIQHQDDVQLVELSADGKLAFSVSKYDKALVWDSHTGTQLFEIPLAAEHIKRGMRFTAARFSEDNRFILTGRPDGVVSLWDIENRQLVKEWKAPKRDAWQPTGASILAVSFSTTETNVVYAIASGGFVHSFKLE